MAPAIGPLLKRTRQVRALSAADVARAAGISAAYLSKLERDSVKKPSPPVLHQLIALVDGEIGEQRSADGVLMRRGLAA